MGRFYTAERKMQRVSVRLGILEAIFIASLLASNILAVRLLMVGKFIQSAGIIAYPITFLVTDAVGDVFGKRRAQMLVWLGFLAQLFFLLLITAGRYLPHPPFWEGQAAYVQVVGLIPRIVLGSLVAYIIAQTHDVWAFHFLKKRTRGRWLWLRNNVSTMMSQGVDSLLFVTIAFAGTVPTAVLWQMVAVQYVTKLLIAAVDTPFCYLLVGWLNSGAQKDVLGGRSQSFETGVHSG